MKRFALAMVTLVVCAGAHAASEDVEMNLVTSQGVGQFIGTVKITETDKGLEFAPDLKALPPGEHGFHVHAKGSCQPAMKEGKPTAAEAAGGISTRTTPVSMKARKGWGTSAICRCWW